MHNKVLFIFYKDCVVICIVYLHKLFGSFSIDRRFINEGIKHQYGVSICWLSTKSELLSFFRIDRVSNDV